MNYLLMTITLLSFSVSQDRTAAHIYYGPWVLTEHTQRKLQQIIHYYNLLILIVPTSFSPYERCMSSKFSENRIFYGLMGNYVKYLSCDGYITAQACPTSSGTYVKSRDK